MSKTVRVEVTAEDIAAGRPLSETACPVAIAMSRTLGQPICISRGKWKGHTVGVARFKGGIGFGSFNPEWRLSRAVGDFTRRFDWLEPVEPFAFRVWR